MANQVWKLSGMVVLFSLGVSAIILTVAAAQDEPYDPKKDPWYGLELPEEPRPNYYKFLASCIRNLTQTCGMEMFDYIFNVRKDLDKPCCGHLLQMGEVCSTSLSYTLSHIEKFAPWRGHIYLRARSAYELCGGNYTI